MGKSYLHDDYTREIVLSSDGKTVALHVDVDANLHLVLSKEKKSALLEFLRSVAAGKKAELVHRA